MIMEPSSSNDGKLKTGEIVRVRRAHTDEDWCPAQIGLCSSSDKPTASVVLILHGIVRAARGAFIGGVLPLTVDYDREMIIGLDEQEYEIEVAGEDGNHGR